MRNHQSQDQKHILKLLHCQSQDQKRIMKLLHHQSQDQNNIMESLQHQNQKQKHTIKFLHHQSPNLICLLCHHSQDWKKNLVCQSNISSFTTLQNVMYDLSSPILWCPPLNLNPPRFFLEEVSAEVSKASTIIPQWTNRSNGNSSLFSDVCGHK